MIAASLRTIAEAIGARIEHCRPDTKVRRVSTDSRTLRAGDLFFAIAGERFDGHAFVTSAAASGAVACVVRDGFQPKGDRSGQPLLVVDDVGAALGRLACWHRRQCRATVIAVTGSNGKTTVKGMIAHALSAVRRGRASIKSYNNHIGVPLTLLAATADDEFLVVEIGSSAPGEIAALARLVQPDVGVITSIGHAHVEGLGGIDGIRAEKLALLAHLRQGGLAVVHDAIGNVQGALPAARSMRVRKFGTTDAADCRVTDITGDLHATRAQLNAEHALRLTIPGAHNALNAAAAFTVCREVGMTPPQILDALATFQLAALRLNFRSVGGIEVINDCYNANPTSMTAAIELLGAAGGRRHVLVAGEMAELGEHSESLHREVGRQAASAADMIVAVGEQARLLAETAAACRRELEILCVADAAEAGERLAGALRSGDVVLIKGSRCAALESIAERLDEVLGRPTDQPAPPVAAGG